jgi:hypothetical protein
VKEVNIDSDDRFVICFNPNQATLDAAIRPIGVHTVTDCPSRGTADVGGRCRSGSGDYGYMQGL